jgi:hypothetical protein
MTDSVLLKKRIKNCGFTVKDIARHMNLSRQGLWKKINNRTEFRQSEIAKLSEILELDSDMERRIFFKMFVD